VWPTRDEQKKKIRVEIETPRGTELAMTAKNETSVPRRMHESSRPNQIWAASVRRQSSIPLILKHSICDRPPSSK
jgi:hypothetical protein